MVHLNLEIKPESQLQTLCFTFYPQMTDKAANDSAISFNSNCWMRKTSLLIIKQNQYNSSCEKGPSVPLMIYFVSFTWGRKRRIKAVRFPAIEFDSGGVEASRRNYMLNLFPAQHSYPEQVPCHKKQLLFYSFDSF